MKDVPTRWAKLLGILPIDYKKLIAINQNIPRCEVAMPKAERNLNIVQAILTLRECYLQEIRVVNETLALDRFNTLLKLQQELAAV